MNKESIVNDMVSFIEEAERNLQASAFVKDAKTSKKDKKDIVNRILDELEKKVSDEN